MRNLSRLRLVLLGALTLPIVAVAVLAATFDPDAQRPRVAAAVEAATGRALTLGRLALAFTPLPTVTIADAALANLPGGSRPEMLRVGRAEAAIALWPLLSGQVVIRRLTLQNADLLIERDAQGRPNWSFDPPSRTAATDAPAAAREASRALGVLVDALAVVASRIAWRDADTGRTETLELARLAADPRNGGRVGLVATLALRAVPIRLEGEAGDLRAAAAATDALPWPFRLAANAAGAHLTIEGSAADPLRGAGWRATLATDIPALAALAPLLPGLPLPPLRGIVASAELAAGAPGGASLGRASLAIAESDLGSMLPGLVLARLSATAAPAEPARLDAAGRIGDLPLQLAGTIGRTLPTPIDLVLRIADATVNATGLLPRPPAADGADLVLTLRAPPRREWPGLGAVEGSTRLALPGPGLAGGATFSALALTSAAGDLAGEVSLRPGERPRIDAQLASRRLDLAALRPPAVTVVDPGAAPVAAPGGASPPARAVPPPTATGGARRIPDATLPFETLRRLDATIGWSIAELAIAGRIAGSRGGAFRNVTLDAELAAGQLRLAATAPAGTLRFGLNADGAATPPRLHLTASGAGADAAALLGALGAPSAFAGRLDLDIDLRGAGQGLRGIAASAAGHAGLALIDGRADATLLRGLPAEARALLLPPGAATADGGLPLRCVALRARVEAGLAGIETLLLESPIGRVGGGGTLNLADEVLALRLTPDLRVGPIQLRAPVRIGGTLAAPRFAVPIEGAVAGGIGALLSLQRSGDRGLQDLAGALAGGGVQNPECAAALTLARGGRAGPMPAGAGPVAAPIPEVTRDPDRRLPTQIPAPLQDLFRGLLGR